MKALAVAIPLPDRTPGESARGSEPVGRGGEAPRARDLTRPERRELHGIAQAPTTARPAPAHRGVAVALAPDTDITDIGALYRRYGDMVYGRCLSLLRNDADAIDATQEVFLKAHRYASSFEGRSKPSTWLYRIATNHCLNVIRSRKRRPEDPVEEIEDHRPPPVGDSVLDRLAGSQLVQVLLEGWDERTQQCVVYHYLDGMTHDEVGELLGISGAAVRKRLAKFRQQSQERHPAWAGWRAPGSSSEEP